MSEYKRKRGFTMADSHFPADTYQALAMLYVQNQDTSQFSPEELYKLYEETYAKIIKYARENKNSKWTI